MSIELKIKSKTLAAEARIIRFEKNRQRAKAKLARALHPDQATIHADAASSLQSHGALVVRKAARSTHIAACFLRGTPYKKVEAKLRKGTKKPDWEAVERMVKKYGTDDPRDLMQTFSAWKAEADDAE